jgi:folylpolyglutamate synthase
MVSVRERIRINGIPLSEEDFAKYFFEVWDALDANTKVDFFPSFSLRYIHRVLIYYDRGRTWAHRSDRRTFDL